MDLIPSFSVDHTKIVPGIFTSRVDVLGDQKVTTYDVRVTRPNIEKEIYDLILGGFRSVEDTEEVPGASAVNCGNYLMHNLEFAKWYARKFADYLSENAGNPKIFEYPKSERLVTEDGRQFFDS